MKDSTRKIIRKKSSNDDEQRLKRCSANSRERQRTQEINAAFNMLRHIIPSMPADKMSKIHTLRIATAYIAYLGEMLNGQTEIDSMDCNPQTSFHVWRSSKAQRQLSTSLTSLSLLDSNTFERYSNSNNLAIYSGNALFSSSSNETFCKSEWIERSVMNMDEYSASISYNNASTFSNQSAPQMQPQRQLINHSKK
uniref:BHLH domain-containing protein n=1 Tax=Panagrolaimus superbus TaxID=310955 RepID=A0A914YI00_9BILA